MSVQATILAAERSVRSVFVGNIPYEATEEQLKDIFSEVGPVISFRLVYDRENGKPKGYGFCEYKDQETALSAMRNLNGYELNGRSLRVDNATSEKNREELKNLQASLGGPPVESPFGAECDPDKAPEAISKAVASLPPEQMHELMKQMKYCIQNNPNEARNMLLQNPQLAYALLQALVVLKLVEPQVAMALLHQPNVASQPLLPKAEPQSPVRMGNNQQAGGPSQGQFGNFGPGQFNDQGRHGGMHEQQQRPMDQQRGPPRDFPMRDNRDGFDNRNMDDFRSGGPGGGPPREHMGRDQRDPRDMPMDEMRRMPFDPRMRGDPRGGPGPGPGPMDFGDRPRMQGPPFDNRGPMFHDRGGGGGFDQRERFDHRNPRGPPHEQHRGGGGGEPHGRPPMGGPPMNQNQPGPPMNPGMGQAIAAQLGNQNPEKAALIMQVLQLSDEQIAMLPAGQRQSIMILKEQLARGQKN